MKKHLLCAAFCFLVAFSLAASENLLSNPGFENSSDAIAVGWSKYTDGTPGGDMSVVNDKALAHSGNKCVKIENVKGWHAIMQSIGSEWNPAVFGVKKSDTKVQAERDAVWDPESRTGKRQRYLAKVFAKGKGNLTIKFFVYGKNVVWPKGYKGSFAFTTTDEWKEYEAGITLPEGASHMNMCYYANGPGAVYLDDAQLYDAREAQVRFLPSKESLVASVNTAFLRWDKKLAPDAVLSAVIEVYAKGKETSPPVLKERFASLKQENNSLKLSTAKLPEGEYTVQVLLKDQAGKELGREDDWFEKRIFEWMKTPRGIGPEVPPPYTALEVKDQTVISWGRSYQFDPLGLLASVTSQGKQLSKKMELKGIADGKELDWKVKEAFAFSSVMPTEVRGRAKFQGGKLDMLLESFTEYDGFIKLRLTYAPLAGQVNLNRLRLKVPLAGAYCKFYSVDGVEKHWKPESKDPEGGYANDVLPSKQGKLFDSMDRPQTWKMLPPSFTGLLWLADHETSFCYAADNDEGWLLRDDAPSVELFREGEDLVLWLNLVNREYILTKPRTLEFAFQSGPTKPLPEGWRGIQNGGDPGDAPLTLNMSHQAGSGYTMAGATHFIHPGDSPEQRKKSKEKIEKETEGGKRAIVGYHFWGTVPKGFPETRVFRSEWGIDKDKWEMTSEPRGWEWKNRFFGENKDLCIFLYVKPVPSYVDFTIYAYDEALKETALSGFYDDVGYPKPVFDEDLGIGYVREDGNKISSSGLWIYRERWKRAAYLNYKHNRPNYTWDSQHIHAHYMPAYNFIGIWAPCEKGYYNSFKDRDILDYYGSIERYAAFNPARQFGQIPMVGMSSFRKKDPKLFAQDTRCMMMLAFLNDQDVGSFGERDIRTVCRLRHARNIFKPWEKDVQFVGYWRVRTS